MPDPRKLIGLVAVASALGAAGCGDDESNGGGGGGDSLSGSGCLSPAAAQREINQIAGGVEASQEDVEAKQEAIRQVQARECN